MGNLYYNLILRRCQDKQKQRGVSNLKDRLDNPKGFSENNLRYMRAFYRLYSPLGRKLQQLVGDFPLSEKQADFSVEKHVAEVYCGQNKPPSNAQLKEAVTKLGFEVVGDGPGNR